MYHIRFDFDAQGEPPAVYIYKDGDKDEDGDIIRVIEEPICKLGGKIVKEAKGSYGLWNWEGPWSWDDEDWEPGALAKKILKFLREETV